MSVEVRIEKSMQAKQRLVPMYKIENVVDLSKGKKPVKRFIKRDMLCDGPNPTIDEWKRDHGWNLFDPSVVKANGDDVFLKENDPELYAAVFKKGKKFKPQDVEPQELNADS